MKISDAKLKGLMDGKLFYVSQLQEKKDRMRNGIVRLSTVSFFAYFYVSVEKMRFVLRGLVTIENYSENLRVLGEKT